MYESISVNKILHMWLNKFLILFIRILAFKVLPVKCLLILYMMASYRQT